MGYNQAGPPHRRHDLELAIIEGIVFLAVCVVVLLALSMAAIR